MRYIVIIPVLALGLLAMMPSCGGVADEGEPGQYRAAIVDQLYVREPNPELITEMKALLGAYGFSVDLWQGDNITVDFYRGLPDLGYKLVILRVHSGILLAMKEEKIEPLEGTYLFTAEEYSTTRYVSEQLSNKVANAMMTDDYPLVFAVNSEFFRKDTKGKFTDTLIIAAGCESFYFEDMAEAFIDKGASSYIGWSTIVSLEYTDEVLKHMLTNLLTNNMTLEDSTALAMAELGHDPYFGASLRYYPSNSGSHTVKELIK
jgi:hypothetical protein